MKVIFLDIDGVLNSRETLKRLKDFRKNPNYLPIDDFRVPYLKAIIEETNSKIVLISSWRRYFKKEENNIIPTMPLSIELNKLFLQNNIEIYDLIGKEQYGIEYREKQIIDYLEKNNIDEFIIIDDEISSYEILLDKVINTSIKNKGELVRGLEDTLGLSPEHIDVAINMLNEKKVHLTNSN